MIITGGPEKIIRDLSETNVTNYTKNGKCSNCGSCCTDLMPVTDAEIKKIHKYLKTHKVKPQKSLVASSEYDMTCPFRDNINRKCTIYEVRPGICKTFICNATKSKIEADKQEAIAKTPQISMRSEFFGDESTNDMLRNIATMIATFQS